MLKQLDNDNNLTLVLSDQETAALQGVLSAAGMAFGIGLAPAIKPDLAVLNELIGATYLYTDEQLIEANVATHADHEGDDLEGIREAMTKLVPQSRQSAIELGILAA